MFLEVKAPILDRRPHWVKGWLVTLENVAQYLLMYNKARSLREQTDTHLQRHTSPCHS